MNDKPQTIDVRHPYLLMLCATMLGILTSTLIQ